MNMPPETRLEQILSGVPLEPITRLEWFLQQAVQGGGGDVLPSVTYVDAELDFNQLVNPTITGVDGDGVADIIAAREAGAEVVLACKIYNMSQDYHTVTDVPLRSITSSTFAYFDTVTMIEGGIYYLHISGNTDSGLTMVGITQLAAPV